MRVSGNKAASSPVRPDGTPALAVAPRPARGRIQRPRAAHRAAGSMGLATWSFMPAAKQRWRSASMAFAVIAMMGSWACRGLLRRARVAVSPSMTGICISMSTAS